MTPRRPSCSAHTTFSTATSFITGSRKVARSKEPDRHGKTREAFLARASDVEAHQALGFGGRVLPTEQPYLAALRIDRCDLRAWRPATFAERRSHPRYSTARARSPCLAVRAGPDRATRSTRSGGRSARAADAFTTPDGAGQRLRSFWRSCNRPRAIERCGCHRRARAWIADPPAGKSLDQFN